MNPTEEPQPKIEAPVFEINPIGKGDQGEDFSGMEKVEQNIELTPEMLMNEEAEKTLEYVDAINAFCGELNAKRAELSYEDFLDWVEKAQKANRAQEVKILTEELQGNEHLETETTEKGGHFSREEIETQYKISANPKHLDVIQDWAST